MRRGNPFAPVPLSGRSQPIVVRRDRRAFDLDHHLATSSNPAHLEGETTHRRLVIFLLSMFALVIARLMFLQIVQGAEHRQAAERNRIRLEIVRAPRGTILDRHRQPLLENVPDFTLYATPADLPRNIEDRRQITRELLSALPNIDGTKLTEAVAQASTSSLQPIILADHVTYENAIRLTTVIARLPGISLDVASSRQYLFGSPFAHLVGYLGKPTGEELRQNANLTTLSDVGRMGIERSYDKLLRGTDGVREIERDHLNKQLAILGNRNPVPGNNLVLTIDQGLQTTLFDSLQSMVSKLHVSGGAAVALDPRTGEVLALASVPSFDPNLFTQGGAPQELSRVLNDQNHPLFFRPISGTYPSGSTVKPVIAAAALAEGVITPSTTVLSTGGIKVGPNFFPDWKAGGHGVTNIEKALAESVNTFFYTIGGGYQDFSGLGVDRIVDYMKRFGLAAKLGVDLPNEADGFLPDAAWRSRPNAQRWYLGDTYNLSIGQGYVEVTPLQVAAYTAAIANGGTLYQPHVLLTTLNADGTVVAETKPSVIRTTVSDRFLATVRAGMRQAVTSGSARGLQTVSVPVAAKTGTAQFGDGQKTHAWITAFAPYDRPEIVISVIIEAGGEGSSNALPVARQGLEWYFSQRP